MIHGVGTDIVRVARLADALERHGARFAERILDASERAAFAAAPDPARLLAKRFAAKEACAKALGTGMRMGTAWREMGVVNLRSGRPTLELSGGAAERLKAITPSGMHAVIHLTITDDKPFAQAFVVIEALPAG